MIRVNSSDCLLHPFIKRVQAVVFPVGRLVNGVVARHPSVVLEILRGRVNEKPVGNAQTKTGRLTSARCSQILIVLS
jgi:hypothetical protein